MNEERASRNPLTWALTALVRAYQLIVSPWFAPTCRYYPSCSTYAVQALQRHGPVRGLGLAIWRLLRCNPWSAGGVNQVPPRRGRKTGHHTHEYVAAPQGRTLVVNPVRAGSNARA